MRHEYAVLFLEAFFYPCCTCHSASWTTDPSLKIAVADIRYLSRRRRSLDWRFPAVPARHTRHSIPGGAAGSAGYLRQRTGRQPRPQRSELISHFGSVSTRQNPCPRAGSSLP
ncbi:hypothetical protein N658DRAFT_120609 [Parathielavia hyrcaniae]|uniref:Uncharacterized protein n=1 Tax=Parathielavia hyrcaniae TaxID=113614 RepID=A0AAN6Q8A1_9PEZI|nr:hypothetical protein N658DRAFT_120609 [Parathielavia hyrcaniae]